MCHLRAVDCLGPVSALDPTIIIIVWARYLILPQSTGAGTAAQQGAFVQGWGIVAQKFNCCRPNVLSPKRPHTVLLCPCSTHRRCRRDATVELSRVGVGGVYWAYVRCAADLFV